MCAPDEVKSSQSDMMRRRGSVFGNEEARNGERGLLRLAVAAPVHHILKLMAG